MDNEKQSVEKRRLALKNRLKGSLNVRKLDKDNVQQRKCSVTDRTPQPGVTKTCFEDSFVLHRKIGQGAHASVYKCQKIQTGIIYAVKISRGDQEILRISKRTYKILKKLRHPNLIKPECLYLNQINQKIHFVMQYCPYPTLAEIQSLLTEADKKNIITKLLNIFYYLHSEGVCHRDVKLENILYDQVTGNLKLIDFGVCKKIMNLGQQETKQKMWTNTGTLQYMAPQILLGLPYDQSVDCWALGILAYKLFYGSFPFESEYKSDMIQQICNSEPAYEENNDISSHFIKHLLMKNPNMRLTTEEGLHHPWIENPRKKLRFASENDIEILSSKNRNNSHCQESQKELFDEKLNKAAFIDKISIKNDIFYHKRNFQLYNNYC